MNSASLFVKYWARYREHLLGILDHVFETNCGVGLGSCIKHFFFSFFALAQVSFPNSAHAWTLQYLELNSRGEIKEISLK